MLLLLSKLSYGTLLGENPFYSIVFIDVMLN